MNKLLDETIYYDPRTGGAFTIKKDEEQSVIITDPSEFLNDAKTNVLRYRISKEYFQGCKTIDETSPLVEKYFFSDRFPNDFAYHLKQDPKSVYQNPNFEYMEEETNKAQAEWNQICYPYGEPDDFDYPDDLGCYDDYPEDESCYLGDEANWRPNEPEETPFDELDIYIAISNCLSYLRDIGRACENFQFVFGG